MKLFVMALPVIAAIMPFFQNVGIAGDLPIEEDLARLDLDKREDVSYREFVRKSFLITDARLRDGLSTVIRQPLMPQHLNGLKVVLYCNGAQGFIWGLEELAKSSDVNVRFNIFAALRFREYRETYLLGLCLLNDKRPGEVPRGMIAGTEPWHFVHGYEPDRISDCVFSDLLMMLHSRHQLPENLKTFLKAIGYQKKWEDRDKGIAILKDWWAREGERLITATRPSVVEVLIKEAEEKTKKEAEQKAK